MIILFPIVFNFSIVFLVYELILNDSKNLFLYAISSNKTLKLFSSNNSSNSTIDLFNNFSNLEIYFISTNLLYIIQNFPFDIKPIINFSKNKSDISYLSKKII